MVVNNSVILQWGTGNTSGQNYFPIAFTQKACRITVGHQYYNNNLFAVVHPINLTYMITAGGPAVTVWFDYMVIGF